MHYGTLLLIFTLSCVEEVSPRFEETCDRIVITYNGEQADAKTFGESLGLIFVRRVLKSRYEFRLNSVSFDDLVKSYPKNKPQKLKFQKRVKRAVTINDAQWSNQWHLQTSQSPSMNVYNAWDKGYTGSGVTIAIVDDGIDIDHSDLLSNYNSALSYDIIHGVSDPSHIYSGDGHGTNCAGVAAAVKNTNCVIGVAYEASLPAIRILDENYPATESDEAMALTHQLSSIDIYSNSWGPSDDGETFSVLTSIQEEAFQTGVTEGRGGNGAIYTWASGNGGDYYDDCNADGYASSIYTISIAAVSQTTAPTWYSEHCTAILAATYSGDDPNAKIVTTGPADTCVSDFTGTSAACPVASGICALTLQANSALTWRDMQHMIVEYSTSSGLHSDASFYSNGAGKQVSHWFGFGLMDAEAMVDNAPSWSTVPASTSCSSKQIDVYSSSVTSSITSTHNAVQCYITYLEHVVVTISYKASFRGDVEFSLESPLSTQSKIFRSREYDSSSSEITWDFMSVHTWGENPEGDWTLTMSDAYGGTTGTAGGSCTDSDDCSGIADGGCLDDGKVCVSCNNGYRILNKLCKQDGRLGGYCDDTIVCAFSTLECSSNICEEKGTDDEENKASLIAGAVVGAVVGVVLIIVAVYLAYKFLFAAKATATVRPTPSVYPAVYSSQPPPYSVSGTHTAYSGSQPTSVPGPPTYSNPAV